MSEEKRYQPGNEISMKPDENESDVGTSHPPTSDTREPRSTIATTSDAPLDNGLSENNSNHPIHFKYGIDSDTNVAPFYELKPEESFVEREGVQFRDLLKPDVLLQQYWTCISPRRLGRRCRVRLPRKNIQLANQEIMRLQADFPNGIPSEAELVKLSKLLLCQKFHQSQAAKIATAWKKELSVSPQQNKITTVDKDVTPINIIDKFVPFSSQQPSSILSTITAVMRKPPSPLDFQHGSVYVFARPETPSMIKIGTTSGDVLRRLQQHSVKCHYHPNLISQHFVNHRLRAEKLIHCSLMEHRRQELTCNDGKGCNSRHFEWFEIDSKQALSTVERWTRWINLKPYVSDRLDPFWEFNLFEAEQLSSLDAFHQWIEHMTQSCIEKGEESWRGRRDGRFWSGDDDEAQLSSSSPPSLVSGTTFSSTSLSGETTSTVEKFITWLLKDEVIQPLLVIATDTIGAEKLEGKFRQLLQMYSKDLQAEALTPSEVQAAQFVRASEFIAAKRLRRQLKQETKEKSRQFQTLSRQEPDKDELMKRFGLAKAPLQMGTVNKDSGNIQNLDIYPRAENQSLDDIEWYENELENIGLDGFDLDDIERDDSENDDADIPSIPNLGLAKEFMITSESFGKLRKNLKDFVFPPRQHLLEDLVGIETQEIDPTQDVAAIPEIESDKRVAKRGLFKIIKDNSNFIVSNAMSYLLGYIVPMAPLAAGRVRLNWACTCGHSSYDDFRELRPGAVAEYAERLLRSGYVTRAQPTTQEPGPGAVLLTSAKNHLAAVRRNIPKWKTNKSGKNPKPKGRKFAEIQCSPTPGVTCRWLHLCLKKRPKTKVTKLEPLHVCKDEGGKDLTDETLFKLLRKAWRIQRSWADLRLFKLTKVEFIKFLAVPDDSVDRVEINVVPPDTSHYDFILPSPSETVPPISPENFVHLLEEGCNANSQSGLFYFSQLPKKKDKPLKFSPTLVTENVGYGLRFVEEPNQSNFATCLFVVTVLLGTSFGVLWTVFKHDLQGGWAISAYFVSVMALGMVTWQIRATS